MFNHDAKIQALKLGTEEQPLLVIDDALQTPGMWVDQAAKMKFDQVGPYYPGPRAPLPQDITGPFVESASGLIENVFGFTPGRTGAKSLFSIVTADPGDLDPIQRVPHFDGTTPEQMAAMVYLFHDSFGGTNFYRHIETGYETVTAARYGHYSQCMKSYINAHGLPPETYMRDGAYGFERIFNVPAKFNRLIIYKGTQLHSGDIIDPAALSPDPKKGRLTFNVFM